jgi:gluconokinase
VAVDFVLGVDIGTTGCKTIATDRVGNILSSGNSHYGVSSPRPGWAEQDPKEVAAGVIAAVRECMSCITGQPLALCFAGALHSLFVVDSHGEPLLPALTWTDTRSQQEVTRLKQSPGLRALYSRTGCPLHPMYPLAKIEWLRDQVPDALERAAYFVSVKDYCLYHLTGEWLSDISVASGSGLLNVHTMTWDQEALALAGIDVARLPPLASPITRLGRLKPDRAQEMGVDSNTPVIIGASDAALSNVGAGAVEPGVLVLMVGSSGAIRTLATSPQFDECQRTWCYVLDSSHWIVGGAINSGGLALQWLADWFQETSGGTVEKLVEEAAGVGAGAEGLVFLPFMAGERSPNWNADARGSIFGLSLHHGRAHVARALLEGIAYQLRLVFEAVEQIVGHAIEVRGSGGFLNSSLWTCIVADVLGRSIAVPSTPNTSAMGAAFLGWQALGEMQLADAAHCVVVERRVQANLDNYLVYSRLYSIYQELIAQLDDAFREISHFQAGLVVESVRGDLIRKA